MDRQVGTHPPPRRESQCAYLVDNPALWYTRDRHLAQEGNVRNVKKLDCCRNRCHHPIRCLRRPNSSDCNPHRGSSGYEYSSAGGYPDQCTDTRADCDEYAGACAYCNEYTCARAYCNEYACARAYCNEYARARADCDEYACACADCDEYACACADCDEYTCACADCDEYACACADCNSDCGADASRTRLSALELRDSKQCGFFSGGIG